MGCVLTSKKLNVFDVVSTRFLHVFALSEPNSRRILDFLKARVPKKFGTTFRSFSWCFGWKAWKSSSKVEFFFWEACPSRSRVLFFKIESLSGVFRCLKKRETTIFRSKTRFSRRVWVLVCVECLENCETTVYYSQNLVFAYYSCLLNAMSNCLKMEHLLFLINWA